MDSNLLKEAIADAKAVRQTALANAKVALEEAFNEKYQAMFAEKLKEEAESGMMNPAGQEQEMKSPEENVSEQEIDELIKELEAEVGDDQEGHPEPDADNMPGAVPPAAGEGEPDADNMPGAVPPMGGAPGAVPPMGGAPGATGQFVICPVGQMATAGMTPVTIPGMGGAPAPGAGAPGEVPPAMPAMPPAPSAGGEIPPAEPSTQPPSDVPPVGGEEEETDEDINLNELLESLKEEVEEEGKKEEQEEGCKEEEEEGKKLDEQTKLATSAIGGKVGGTDGKKPSSSASSTSKIESAANDDEGYPTTDNAKVTAKEATNANRPNKATHATKDNLSTPSFGGKGGNSSGGNKETGMPSTDNAKVTAKEATNASRPNQAKNATKTNLSTPGGMLQENNALKSQLNEAEDVIKYVKGQLNEVNLLNGKLLYTNKLFKEYNMNNTQKMRIVEMFDLAKTIREVKLTYANIAESLNFGGGDIKKRVVATTNSSVQSITEGLASRAVGSTKPKEIISEGKFASRMQQLAGIKKK